MWTLKNDNRVSFTVRLNLNNPRHREAYERLRSASGSHTATIVDTLIREERCTTTLSDADALKTIVRQAVAEALSALSMQSVHTSAESSGKREITDEDFDIADDFMNSLGC